MRQGVEVMQFSKRSSARLLQSVVLVTFMGTLAGCELLPMERASHPVKVVDDTDLASCDAEVPNFAESPCMLTEWVAFGLASQRGDREWRDNMLPRLAGHAPEQRLSRAVVMSWGSESQWDQASELYKADLQAAPSELQPLFRYWLNELEGRRKSLQRVGQERSEVARLTDENQALADKLEAMTAIEQSINLRQQVE